MEPTRFTVKEESQFKSGDSEFVAVKLMTRLTYTLDQVRLSLSSAHVHTYVLGGLEPVVGAATSPVPLRSVLQPDSATLAMACLFSRAAPCTAH